MSLNVLNVFLKKANLSNRAKVMIRTIAVLHSLVTLNRVSFYWEHARSLSSTPWPHFESHVLINPVQRPLTRRGVDLPWFGDHVAAVLWRWALTHHRGHVNVKVFGDILYVGLGEAHSTYNRMSCVTACFIFTSNKIVLHNSMNLPMTSRCVKHMTHVKTGAFVYLYVFYLWLCVSGRWGIFCAWPA